MCAMISAVSKDFHVMWGTGSPAVAIEHCHNPHTRPDALVLDMAFGGKKITGADVCRRIRRRSGGTGSVFTYVHRVADKLGVASRKEVLDACARYDLLCPGFPSGLACGMPGIR